MLRHVSPHLSGIGEAMVPEPSSLKPEKQEVLGIQVVVGSDEHGEASFEVATMNGRPGKLRL